MATYSFPAFVNQTIASFNPSTDLLDFPGGYEAASLSLEADGGDTLVWYGGQWVRLQGVASGALGGTQFVFADGSVFRQGVAGADSFAGTDWNDQFLLTAGGTDSVAGSPGSDDIRMGATLNGTDSIHGGTGYDELFLAGNYSLVTLGATTVTGIERFVFGQGGTVRLRLHQAVFTTADEPVTFDASTQAATDGLYLDGRNVSIYGVNATGGAGADSLLGGAAGDSLVGAVGSDSLAGGAGNDTLAGGLDADTLVGGTGNDRFVFQLGSPRTDASPSTIDTITDFDDGDLIDLPGLSTFNGYSLVFNATPLEFSYNPSGESGQQDFENDGDGFVDVYWRNNAGAGRLEVWVDGNDDGQFSETDMLVYLTNTATTGKTSLVFSDFADNFVAWRGTSGNDLYDGNANDNTAYGLAGDDTMRADIGSDTLYGGLGHDSLEGEDGSDWLYGGSGNDVLLGGQGDDYLDAQGPVTPTSGYVYDALTATNQLDGGSGNDNLYGADGKDTLQGGTENDNLDGKGGNDLLNGGSGDDYLSGGDGNDALQGVDGNDVIYGGNGNDNLNGGAGNDTLNGYGVEGELETLSGADGDDEIFALGWGTRSTLTGGLGADRFMFSPSMVDVGWNNYEITGSTASTVKWTSRITDFNESQGDLIRTGISEGIGTGNKAVVWRGTADAGFTATAGQSMSLAGALASDTDRFLEFWTFYDSGSDTTVLFMDRNRDFVVDDDDLKIFFTGNVGLSTTSFTSGTFTVKVGTPDGDTNTTPVLTTGDDLVYGGAGNDSLSTLEGHDTVNGEAGNDTLLGAGGNDQMFGGAGNDSLDGGTENDQLFGGVGADTLNGGDGQDGLYAANAADSGYSSFDEDAPGTVNVLNGNAGDDGLYGSAGSDSLRGGTGDDGLQGEAGNDRLYGDAGNDGGSGGAGNDSVFGGLGNDSLNGGEGNDLVDGNEDHDWLATGSDPAGADTLRGGTGNDTLMGSGEQVTMTGGDDADRFVFSGNLYDEFSDPWGPNIVVTTTGTSVGNTALITDFDAAGGDRIRTGITTGNHFNVPLVWRGVANAGFTGTIGESLGLAGSDADDKRFFEFWTWKDTGAGRTYLFLDRDRDFEVDANDLKIAFTGQLDLDATIFTPGTFVVKVGTVGADTNTAPVLGTDGDLAYAFAGNDVLDGLAGNDTLNGDAGNDSLAGGADMDRLHGSTGNDTLRGGDLHDVLEGGTGADSLYGGAGNDQLSAQGYADSSMSVEQVDTATTVNRLFGETGDDGLYGGAGRDSLDGGADDDWASGAEGDDTLLGGTGHDSLQGGLGNDSITGGDGNDWLAAGDGQDTANGGTGNDTLSSGSDGKVDLLRGEDGDDVLLASGDRAVLAGGLGADRFAFSDVSSGDVGTWYNIVNVPTSTVQNTARVVDLSAAQGDLIRTGIVDGTFSSKPLVWRGVANPAFTATLGESVSDAGITDGRFHEFWTFYNAAADRTILFIDRNQSGTVDSLDVKVEFNGNVALSAASFTAGTFTVKVGTSGADTATTPALTAGADLAFALGGDDSLGGLDGNDTLNGDAGNDTLLAGLGQDDVYGGAGDDSLQGDNGADNLYGGVGSDTLRGGEDADQIYADWYPDSATFQNVEDAAGTLNLLYGGAGNDYLRGSTGDDRLVGELDDDTLYGEEGDDTLAGGDGKDYLDAGTGSDSLNGGAGNDDLRSGSQRDGVDTLVGGEGDDVLYGFGDQVVMNGGLGADRFVFSQAGSDSSGFSLITDVYTTVASASRIVDFNAAQGDLLRSGVVGGNVNGIPVLWRGQAAAAFSATVGENVSEAGANLQDGRYYEFWTRYDTATSTTFLFLDRDLDGKVDADDLKILFTGNVVLGADSFTEGTFTALRGTVGNDGAAALPSTEFADQLIGARGNDTVGGGSGDDWLAGNAGADVVNGSAGNDTLLGGLSNDSMNGGDGLDLMYGGSGSDTLAGSTGADTLYASGGEDYVGDYKDDTPATTNSLAGGDGNDVMYGGAGADTLLGQNDADNLYGYGGNDSLAGGNGDDYLAGNEGNDTLDGGAGTNFMDGGEGDDAYYVRNASDVVSGEWVAYGAADRVYSYLAAHTLADNIERGYVRLTTGASLTGNDGSNSLVGSTGADTLLGAGGDDTLDGGAGTDSLAGGLGDDTYLADGTETIQEAAGEGADWVRTGLDLYTLDDNVENGLLTTATGARLNGNTLDNALLGGAGADTLVGGGGADVLQGNGGADSMIGGSGDDTYHVEDAGDVVAEASDSVTGGNDTIFSMVTRALGNYQENLVLDGDLAIDGTGNALDNVLTGNGAANLLAGDAGADTLGGGEGNDTLAGGAGVDHLHGGAGEDVFDFDLVSDSGVPLAVRDLIEDFVSGVDRVDVSGIDAVAASTGSNEAFTFIGSTAFAANAPGTLRFQYDGATATGYLHGNVDADSGSEFIIALAGVSSLAATDLVL